MSLSGGTERREISTIIKDGRVVDREAGAFRQLPLYVLGLNPRDDRHGEMGEPVEDAEQVIVPRASQDLRIGVAAL